jgi:hypothetical protein
MGRGKYPLLDDIKKHLPKGECLIEPFVGAGSVFLNTDFSRYILADINSDLISLYNIVKLRTDEYVAEARKLFTPENNNRTFTISSALSLIRARIRSAARCCSCISTVMATTACAAIICAVNLTCRLVAISARISRRTSCITLLKKRRTQSFIASPMKSVWNWQA